MTQGIGDIDSNERGSGARFNAGKPHTFLIPLTAIASWMTLRRGRVPGQPADPAMAMALLGAFQLRLPGVADRPRLMCAMDELGPDWDNCGRVFDYGRTKYAEWNWAKGMPWSAVISCAEHHLRAMFLGEAIDPESGLPHSGHAMCNLIMLWTYCETYPEGDDRPPAELFLPYEQREPDHWRNNGGPTPVMECTPQGVIREVSTSSAEQYRSKFFKPAGEGV